MRIVPVAYPHLRTELSAIGTAGHAVGAPFRYETGWDGNAFDSLLVDLARQVQHAIERAPALERQPNPSDVPSYEPPHIHAHSVDAGEGAA
jgi:hypothetical protein